MSFALKIHVGRTVDAFARRGIHLRRSLVGEVLASTFGYASSNEATAAAAKGDLDPPSAEPCLDGLDALVVILDPVAGLPFAVHRSVLETGRGTRDRDFCLSPYGNLLDVGRIRLDLTGRSQPEAPRTVREGAPPPVRGTVGDAERHLDRIIRRGLSDHASEIRIEPHDGSYGVHLRILGVRVQVHEGPIVEHEAILRHLKARAGLDPAETRVGQEGSIQLRQGSGTVDLRVTTLATLGSENAIIRILGRDRNKLGLDELGITRSDHWRRGLSRHDGLCLICGASGSGKVTTMNASIREVSEGGRRVYAFGDPVDHRIPDVGRGMSPPAEPHFMRTLKNFMHADPDVIVIGEVGDPDTVRNAVRGIDTGHLVLATLHASSIVSSVMRLRDLGITTHELRHILRAVVVQTLVRTVCPECGGQEVHDGSTCQRCGGFGYAGRTIVSECARFDDPSEVDRVVALTDAGSATRVRMDVPWPDIVDDAVLKMRDGVTTSDELVRVFGNLARNRFESLGIDPRDFALRRRPS